MKNKILLFILAVALFIPTMVGVLNYVSSDGEVGITADIAEKLILTLPDGSEYSFDKADQNTESAEMFSLFKSIEKNSSKILALPDPLVGTPYFTVTMQSGEVKNSFKYYFSESSSDAYYTDKSSNAYKISQSDTAQFLKTKYSLVIYKNAKAPVLTLSSEFTPLPTEVNWKYKIASGDFVDAYSETSSSNESYSLEGGLSLNFNIEPDWLHLTIKNTSGETLFSDLYSNIASLVLKEGELLNVTVDSEWYENEANTFYGSMSYNFSATVTPPATFHSGATSILQGDFIAVSAYNINKTDKISFTSIPDIGYTPKFFLDGDTAVALIPFGAEIAPGSYTLTFTYAGGVAQAITVEVGTRNFRNAIVYNISDEKVASSFSEEAIADFSEKVQEAVDYASPKMLFNGYFSEGVDKNFLLNFGFGHRRTVTNANKTYYHTGVDYISQGNSSVFAANAGEVVFAGETAYSGNTVIIEHGYGLKTWYCHLGNISVSKGDLVTKEQVIGTAGNTGFTNQNGVHVGMSVFNVPVCPYSTWVDGTWSGVPMYSPDKN